MSGEPRAEDGTLLRRVPVIVRSWDGPSSRIGLEMDLSQMPWGPFDALGKRLSLVLPAVGQAPLEGSTSESQVERALRHVEHAADRCSEFAQLANGNQELWLRSQQTWEWIRTYLTSYWMEVHVEGRKPAPPFPGSREASVQGSQSQAVPTMPGAAATLEVAARALRATPLAAWRESLGPLDPDAPTREEAVQTLLGVARILSGQTPGSTNKAGGVGSPERAHPAEAVSSPDPNPKPEPETDPDQVSFDFAMGYDEGYQMGRRVGLALGARKGSRPAPSKA